MNTTETISCAFCGSIDRSELWYYEMNHNKTCVRCTNCARLGVGTTTLSEWSYRYSPDGVRTVNPFATWTVEGQPGKLN